MKKAVEIIDKFKAKCEGLSAHSKAPSVEQITTFAKAYYKARLMELQQIN